MNKLLFTGILVMIVMIVSICVIHIFDNGRYEDVKIVGNIYVEKIPLYYELGVEDKIYTQEDDKFIEVEVNGNS